MLLALKCCTFLVWFFACLSLSFLQILLLDCSFFICFQALCWLPAFLAFSYASFFSFSCFPSYCHNINHVFNFYDRILAFLLSSSLHFGCLLSCLLRFKHFSIRLLTYLLSCILPGCFNAFLVASNQVILLLLSCVVICAHCCNWFA